MKKATLLIYLSISSIFGFAQEVDLGAEYLKAKAGYEKGDYAGAVSILEKIIPDIEPVYTDTSSFFEMINVAALSLRELKRQGEAEQYFTKTADFYSRSGVNFYDVNNFTAQYSLAELHYQSGNFQKAEAYYRNALLVEGKLNGEKTEDYITLLKNIANCSFQHYQFKTVDSIYQVLLPKVLEASGESSVEYASILKSLADLQKSNGKYAEAEANYLKAKGIIKASQGVKHKDYLSVLNSLASMSKQRQKYTEAELYYDEMADIYRSNNGVRSEEYGACINNLANIYKVQNKFEQAEKLLEKTLKAYKSAVGEKNILYINTLTSIAGLYRNTGQYNKAESTYSESKKLLFETKGEKNLDYADLLNNMAILYEETGRYDLAETNFKQALQITKDLLGDKHPSYATTLNNLALLNKNLGHYDQAEPMYKQAMAIRKEKLGESHPDYGASLNNLAEFYESVNRTKEALPLYEQASQIAKKVYGEKHHEYALALNNLANLYVETAQLDKAEQVYKQSLAILKNVLGETHSEYASTLNNLAYLYMELGKLSEAELLFKKDLEIIKNSLGANHPNYAKALSNLADIYEHMGKYAEAEKNYLEAMRIRKEKLGDHHPDYTYTIANLARTYTAMGKYAEANTYWKITINNYKDEIVKYFPSMSEKEKESFYKKFKDRFEQYNSFASMRYMADPSVLSEMYNMQLTTKALLFNSSNKVRQRILNSNDAALIASFKKWQTDKEYLAQLYTLPKGDVKVNIDSLEQKTNELEKELSLKSELFKSATEVNNYTWQDVKNVLRPGESAIEVIRFRKYKADLGGTYVQYKFEGKQEKDSVYYAALIVSADSKDTPKLVLMKNGTDLENRYIAYYANAIRFNVSDEFCYANYWSKITAALPAETKRIYFSPDGVYNKINLLSILNPATKNYIIDENDIVTVTNTKDLLTAKPILSASKKIVLMGDPDFGGGNESSTLRTSTTLKRLPGSGVEVQKIADVVKTNNWAGSLFTGKQSTEDAVKSVKDVKILHIATHGFFKKDTEAKNEQSKVSENPLLKSGLHLSAQVGSAEDGVLTAYEAMNLNLDNTELVVLSACETGLGEVANGEGVYGIQRAFRVAGARSIIISLWKVDDMATQKLMVMFYEEWLRTGNKRQAFTTAQNKLRKEYKDPLYWGAFVIIGE